MAAGDRRRLIVNADDFGLSRSVNEAVIEAHERGILTSASLMITGAAAAEAVDLARAHPTLGVGLHLTVCRGRAASAPGEVPSLIGMNGEFRASPVAAGLRYFFSTRARRELQWEIEAQVAMFRETGLTLDHVNGHLHFHLHPAVLATLPCWKARAARLTLDPLRLDLPLGHGRLGYRLSHWLVFALLAARARPVLRRAGIVHADYLFGLLENERVTEDYILKLLPVLPAGVSELYSHPSLDRFRHEYDALVSAPVHKMVKEQNIELIRHEDLWRKSKNP